MSKTITSPIKRWSGTVTIAEPLTFPQAQAIENAMRPVSQDNVKDGRVWLSVTDTAQLPAVLLCVEKWDLENFVLTPEGTPPASPRVDSHKLIDWLFGEITKIYFGEAEIPNE